jgi:poly-gamma-glutamate synthesis protein (capsule biosynthesis protein)
LVLYGCGDLVNDYEGIGGHREYRGDLRLVYLATVQPDGRLLDLRMLPLQARRMRLEVAEPDSARWLAETLDRHSRALGTRVAVAGDGLQWVQP